MTKISNQYSLTNVLFADAVNGRVGIGTASPTVALDVVGAGRFSGSSTAAGLYLTTDNALQSVQATVSKHTVVGLTVRASTASVFDFSLYSAGGTALITNPTGTNNINFNSGQVWFNGGNVGIGTSSPSALLEVNGSSETLGVSINIRNSFDGADSTKYSGINFLMGSDNGTSAIRAYRTNSAADFQTNLTFWTKGAGAGATSPAERMRITSAGNVGIGTSSPNNRLSIVGANATDMITWTDNVNNTGYLGIRTGGVVLMNADNNLAFATGNSERMRINSGGSLLMAKDAAIGINTVDGSDNGYLALCGAGADGPNRGGHIYLSGNERPDDPGHVTISAGNVIGIGSVITFRTAGVERMRLIGNGRLVIGTSTDQGYTLFVNGNAAGTSGFANVSDRRLKKDIIPIESALNKIKQLNGISFNWDKTLRPNLNVDDNNHLGLIAQDVEEILPQVVTTGDDEFKTKTIAYSDIVPVLIEAIKELSTQSSAQQLQINELKALLNA